MSARRQAGARAKQEAGGHGHAGHGLLAMLACCIPMVAILLLLGFKVI